MSRYQEGKTNLDFTEARDSEWQWHQLGRMQVSTSLQTDNHASKETVSGSGISWDVCKSAPRSRQITTPATLPTNQQHQSTEGILHQQFTTTITDIHFCITQFQFYDSALSLHLLDKWPASPELTKQSSKKI